jgi:alcohol dehydrogenase
MGTNSFTFAQIDEAYHVFKDAAANSALKGAITPS